MDSEKVSVFGPASLSNLGPGFDTLGLCLEGIGDLVTAEKRDDPGVVIRVDAQGERRIETNIPLDPAKNTAGIAALEVLQALQVREGVCLHIKKGFTPGSGIGSSAACAAAAAWAVNLLFGSPYTKNEVIEAVLAGEAVASGARHGDNALPALLGGLILVSSQNPSRYRRIRVEASLWIALIVPQIKVLTREARTMLPQYIPIKKAVFQASALAFMIDAFRSGDLKELGFLMMQDQLAEPVRAQLVPCYNQVKSAALESGAFGCSLTGSGPAMFAITDRESHAATITQAMLDASVARGVKAVGYVSRINEFGATEITE